jgi:hypothetical protein
MSEHERRAPMPDATGQSPRQRRPELSGVYASANCRDCDWQEDGGADPDLIQRHARQHAESRDHIVDYDRTRFSTYEGSGDER